MFTLPFLSEFLSFFHKGAKSTTEWGKDLIHEKIDAMHDIYEKSQHLLETNYALGVRHIARGNIKDAIFRFKIILLIKKGYDDAHYQLGRCLVYQHKKEQAENHLKQVSSSSPHYEEALYLLATLDVANRAHIKHIPLSFIRDYFAHIASEYDAHHCHALDYTGHEKLVAALLPHALIDDTKDALPILDIGCGTGLVGLTLRDHFPSVSVVGVDFVDKMADQAKARGIYTEIYVEDVVHYVQKPEMYQGICAGWLLPYVKNINELFVSLCSIVNEKGFFAFTFAGDIHAQDTFLNPDLESYVHSVSFLESALKKAQWHIVSKEEAEIFKDKRGYIYVCVACE